MTVIVTVICTTTGQNQFQSGRDFQLFHHYLQPILGFRASETRNSSETNIIKCESQNHSENSTSLFRTNNNKINSAFNVSAQGYFGINRKQTTSISL